MWRLPLLYFAAKALQENVSICYVQTVHLFCFFVFCFFFHFICVNKTNNLVSFLFAAFPFYVVARSIIHNIIACIITIWYALLKTKGKHNFWMQAKGLVHSKQKVQNFQWTTYIFFASKRKTTQIVGTPYQMQTAI